MVINCTKTENAIPLMPLVAPKRSGYFGDIFPTKGTSEEKNHKKIMLRTESSTLLCIFINNSCLISSIIFRGILFSRQLTDLSGTYGINVL